MEFGQGAVTGSYYEYLNVHHGEKNLFSNRTAEATIRQHQDIRIKKIVARASFPVPVVMTGRICLLCWNIIVFYCVTESLYTAADFAVECKCG